MTESSEKAKALSACAHNLFCGCVAGDSTTGNPECCEHWHIVSDEIRAALEEARAEERVAILQEWTRLGVSDASGCQQRWHDLRDWIEARGGRP